jgi:dephospho-CoA kinase
LKIIMIVGRMRAGKNTVAELLEEALEPKRVSVINFSDLITVFLDTLGLPKVREHYNLIAGSLAKIFGQGIFAESVQQRIETLDDGTLDFLIICGARFRRDLAVLTGHNHAIIGVTASLETRYERAKQETKDAFNIGSIDDFERADCAPTEGDIDFLMGNANIVFDNDSSPETLWGQVLSFSQALLSE